MHGMLLISYYRDCATPHAVPEDRELTVTVKGGRGGRAPLQQKLDVIRRIAGKYLATARVWAEIFLFELEDANDAEGNDTAAASRDQVMGEVYSHWRTKDPLEATLAWASRLLKKGRAREGMELISHTRDSLSMAARMELEKRWTEVLPLVTEGV